jgi:hypothetical protein
LTPYPQDGARMAIADPFGRLAAFPVTFDANGRTIEGTAQRLVLNVERHVPGMVLSCRLGRLGAKLTLAGGGDRNPFPDDFDNFFIPCGLALRLNPRYGREMDEQSATAFKANRRQFIARYLQSQPLEIDDEHFVALYVHAGVRISSGNFRPIGPSTVVGMGDRNHGHSPFPK